MINVTKSSLPPMEEYIKEIEELWDSHWLTNMGAKHQELENNLKSYLGAENVTLFANGHLALESVLSAMELEGEVITTPFTFVSTTNAITRNGLKPVFCDINEESYTLDTDKLEALITPNTSAIVPVHVYGNICDVEKIEEIAAKHKLKVIYDAAHAFGESLDGRNASTFGDASMFSFHATKVFNTVEGGAVIFKDSQLKAKLDCIKNFGIPRQDRIIFSGGNAKMSEFHAAMGLCNLRHIDEYIAGRRAVAKRYIENLSGISGLKIWTEQQGVTHNYAYYPVVFEGKSRDDVLARLIENGINARKYFYPLANDCECYGFCGDETPIAKHISENVLTLPLYPDLSFDDVDRICEIITE